LIGFGRRWADVGRLLADGLAAAAEAVGVDLELLWPGAEPLEHPATEPAAARQAASRVSARIPVTQAT